jgi:hypothetical protein
MQSSEREELSAALHEELSRLPEKYRSPIVLCHLEGLSNEHAALQLGVPVRSIQRRLAQGRERLRLRLTRRGAEPAIGLLAARAAMQDAPEAWVNSTVRVGCRLAAGQELGAVASASVAILAAGVLTMMYIGRIKFVAAAIVASVAVITAFVGIGGGITESRQIASPPMPNNASDAAAGGGKAADPPSVRIGGWLKGLVVDASGAPVGGARVSSFWTLDPEVVTTKADGTFAIANKEPRLSNVSILATADGGALQGIFRFDDPATGPKDARTLPRIVLKPARTVTVTVADDRGAPVQGAVVSVLEICFPVVTGRTDSRGMVVLRASAESLTQWIVGYKSGVGFDYFENYRSVPPGFAPPPERARLVLSGVRPARVKAVDSSGKAVKGIQVWPITILKRGKLFAANVSAWVARAVTNEEGVATIDWLPIDVAEATSIYLMSPSYHVPRWPVLDVDKLDSVLTVSVFRLNAISGKVTNADGSPAGGIHVEAEGAGAAYPAASGWAVTAGDGSYTMDVPPNQSYLVNVVDDELAAPSRSSVVVLEGKPRAGVDFRLTRGSVIHGRVTAGAQALPAPGVPVILVERGPAVPDGTLVNQPRPLSESATRVFDTDSDGRFAFRVGPGNYELARPGEPGVEAAAEHLKVGEGEEIQRDFRISRSLRQLRAIRGVVRAVRSDGPAIAGAVVFAESKRARTPSGVTDAQGRFELYRPLGIGNSVLYARNAEGDLAGITTVADDDDKEITVVARPAVVGRGRLIDEAGKPRAGTRILYSTAPDLDAPRLFHGVETVVTDGQGRFVVRGLIADGRCWLNVLREVGVSAPQEFRVKGTKSVDFGDIVLRPR